MKVAIASGKGGTGKTTLAVNLALVAGGSVRVFDCDVEEPNCHLFLHPKDLQEEPMCVLVPFVDDSRCVGCGECSRFCAFNAIVPAGTRTLVFAELCHSCGGCAKVCDAGAITEIPRRIGSVLSGSCGAVRLIWGVLDVGEASSPPVVRAVRRLPGAEELSIIDCPPGSSCPMITAIRGSDFVVLVTEPTPFGLHDLTLAVAAVREIGLPCGVVINRADVGDERVVRYCHDEGLPVLLSIPDDRAIAEACSRGRAVVDVIPKMRRVFSRLLQRIREEEAAAVHARGPDVPPRRVRRRESRDT